MIQYDSTGVFIVKVFAINRNYNQNKPSFKAYLKPNANFHILYGIETRGAGGITPKLIKKFNELPNHCIEILKLNKLNNFWGKTDSVRESIFDTTECVLLNHVTKQTTNIVLEDNLLPLNKLIESIIELKDESFFTHESSYTQKEFYNTLTTGKPLDKTLIEIIDRMAEE